LYDLRRKVAGYKIFILFFFTTDDSNVFTLEMRNDLCEVWFEMFVEMRVVVCVKCFLFHDLTNIGMR
jgi:hypothetical protein